MIRRPAALLAAIAAAALLAGCSGSTPPQQAAVPSRLAGCAPGGEVCTVTSKRQVPAKMEADYDRKCVAKDARGKCTKYKRVFDEMEEVAPGYPELCVATPAGEVCEPTDDATYDAYEPGQAYVGRVPA